MTEGEDDGRLRVALLRLPDGFPVVLTEAAALIWLVAADGSDDVLGDVALGAGQPPDLIQDDVESFLTDLMAQGLIERCDNPAGFHPGHP